MIFTGIAPESSFRFFLKLLRFLRFFSEISPTTFSEVRRWIFFNFLEDSDINFFKNYPENHPGIFLEDLPRNLSCFFLRFLKKFLQLTAQNLFKNLLTNSYNHMCRKLSKDLSEYFFEDLPKRSSGIFQKILSRVPTETFS